MFSLRAFSAARKAPVIARAFSATPAASIGFNRVTLVGNIASDVRIHEYSEDGIIVNFTLATNKMRKNREGELVQETDWHRIKAFKTKRALPYYETKVRKGATALIEGSIRYGSYTDKEGNERNVAEIVANRVECYGKLVRQQYEESEQDEQQHYREEQHNEHYRE